MLNNMKKSIWKDVINFSCRGMTVLTVGAKSGILTDIANE
jgi:hypothetical protein